MENINIIELFEKHLKQKKEIFLKIIESRKKRKEILSNTSDVQKILGLDYDELLEYLKIVNPNNNYSVEQLKNSKFAYENLKILENTPFFSPYKKDAMDFEKIIHLFKQYAIKASTSYKDKSDDKLLEIIDELLNSIDNGNIVSKIREINEYEELFSILQLSEDDKKSIIYEMLKADLEIRMKEKKNEEEKELVEELEEIDKKIEEIIPELSVDSIEEIDVPTEKFSDSKEKELELEEEELEENEVTDPEIINMNSIIGDIELDIAAEKITDKYDMHIKSIIRNENTVETIEESLGNDEKAILEFNLEYLRNSIEDYYDVYSIYTYTSEEIKNYLKEVFDNIQKLYAKYKFLSNSNELEEEPENDNIEKNIFFMERAKKSISLYSSDVYKDIKKVLKKLVEEKPSNGVKRGYHTISNDIRIMNMSYGPYHVAYKQVENDYIVIDIKDRIGFKKFIEFTKKHEARYVNDYINMITSDEDARERELEQSFEILNKIEERIR